MRFRYEKKDKELGQIFSAWCKGLDDPLRLCIVDGKLYARTEAGRFHGTKGVAVSPEKWYHVAAVKDGTRLTLYLNGKPVDQMNVPRAVVSGSTDIALAGNPKYRGKNECLACSVSEFVFSAEAMGPDEIAGMAKK